MRQFLIICLCCIMPLQAGAAGWLRAPCCPAAVEVADRLSKATAESTAEQAAAAAAFKLGLEANALTAAQAAAHTQVSGHSGGFEPASPAGQTLDTVEADGCDCCNDLETFARTGQVCKVAPDCGTSVVWLPLAVAPSVAPPASAAPLPRVRWWVRTTWLDRVWRPPTAG